MKRPLVLTALTALTLVAGLSLLPATADAAVGLSWEGRDSISWTLDDSNFVFDLGLNRASHGEPDSSGTGPRRREIRSGIRKIVGGGILLTASVSLTSSGLYLALYEYTTAGTPGTNNLGLLTTLWVGLAFLISAVPCGVIGAILVARGVKQVRRKAESTPLRAEQRYAIRHRTRAQWGMSVRIGGVPVTR